jgi:DNA polymerase I-like protein with 3'-5' exonuclease and polymerase domains
LAADKQVAEQKFFRHFSYRDMAKRGGHAFDYMATARTVAKHLGIPVDVAETFGRKWFEAFPQLRHWQQRTVQEVQTHGYLTTPLGRRRHFLGRLRDDSTLREAVAFRPQSTIADLLNMGLLDLWRKGPRIGLQPLKQVHDAVVGQYPVGQRDAAQALVRECLERPIDVYGKSMIVPCDFAWGYNWGPQTKDNPDGLAGYKPNQQRSRQRPATNNLLHRQVS